MLHLDEKQNASEVWQPVEDVVKKNIKMELPLATSANKKKPKFPWTCVLLNLDEIKVLIDFFKEFDQSSFKAISKMLGNLEFYIEEDGVLESKVPL